MPEDADYESGVWRTDKENDRVVIGDVAITVRDSEGELMAVDHASAMDGYVAFLEKGDAEGMVRSGGESATLEFREADDD